MTMRSDLAHLGEHAVYPGHPAVLAYLILLEYEGRMDEAFAKGLEFPGALENSSVPGAGGNVYGMSAAGMRPWRSQVEDDSE